MIVFVVLEKNHSSATFAGKASPPRPGSLTIVFAYTSTGFRGTPLSLRTVYPKPSIAVVRKNQFYRTECNRRLADVYRGEEVEFR